jgi:hypothetical protein
MAGDPALEDLNDNLKALRRSLDEMGRAAKDAKQGTDGLGAGAAQASGGVSALAGAVKDRLGNALSNLASEALHEATAGLEGFVRNLPEAAARSETHARALEQLGGAYGAVQQATNGAVSAEQAAAVQQRALQSGLRLSAQELAAVTSRAREYARATGTDLGQALEQLTDQLVDPGEELRKFGVFLQTGMSAGDALRETLRQLGAQAQSTGASQLSLAESMEAATRAQHEASDALAGLIAQRLELRDFYTQLASWINDTKDATDGWRVATDAVIGTMREAIGLRSQIGTAQNQSASGQFTTEAGALAAAARARGLNLGGAQFGEIATRGSAAQQNAVLAILRQAGSGGMSQDEVRTQLAAVLGRVQSAARVADNDADKARIRDKEARDAELARRNGTPTRTSSSSTTTPTDTTAQYFRNQTDAAGLQSFLGALAQRAIAQQQEARGGTLAQRQAGVDLQRQSSEAALALDAAGTQGGGGPFSDRARASADMENRQRQERTRILREQREALSGLLVESQREEAIARAMGRPISEVNDLVRQRIGLQTALAQNTRELVASQEEGASAFSEVGEKLISTLEGTADAFGEAVVAALEGSKGFSASMEEMVRSTLRAIAKLAVVEALKNGALAVAALASQNYVGAAKFGVAAGLWTGVAVLSGAGVAAMGTAKPAESSAGASSSAGRSASPDRQARADERSGGGPLVMNITVNGALMTQDEVHHAVGVAVRGASAAGYLAPGVN